jgi:hypothetical protein
MAETRFVTHSATPYIRSLDSSADRQLLREQVAAKQTNGISVVHQADDPLCPIRYRKNCRVLSIETE